MRRQQGSVSTAIQQVRVLLVLRSDFGEKDREREIYIAVPHAPEPLRALYTCRISLLKAGVM